MLSLSASAQWAVVGGYCGWSFQSAVTFTGEGDNLTCEIPSLTSGFKIVDITYDNWDTQYGTSEKVLANTVYTLDGKNGGPDPSNIDFGGGIQEIKNATVTWNPTTFAMEIKAAESDVITGYPTLYATGSFNGWPSPQDSAFKGELEDGVYTFQLDLGDSGNVSFKIATSGWGMEIAGPQPGTVIGYEPVEVSVGGSDLVTTLTGEQTLKLDYDNLQMWFVGEGELPDTPQLEAPEMLYIMGNLEGNSWDPANAVAATSVNDGVFTFSEVNLKNNEPNAWFTFINVLSDDWDLINNGSHRYGPAAGVDGALVVGSTTKFTITTEGTWNIPNGLYKFVVDFNEMTVTVTEDVSAVKSIDSEINGVEVIYNLQGVRVNRNNMTPGIYIINGKKVAVK